MHISSLNALPPGDEELGVVYASVEGVNETSYEECLEKLIHKAHGLGATALVALQLVQSQFQWISAPACLRPRCGHAPVALRRPDAPHRRGQAAVKANPRFAIVRGTKPYRLSGPRWILREYQVYAGATVLRAAKSGRYATAGAQCLG